MAVETFAAFVAEQALGIAVGAVAVVAAPLIGPRLGTFSHDVYDGAKTAVSSVQHKAGGVTATTVSAGGAAITRVRSVAARTNGSSDVVVAVAPADVVVAATPVDEPGALMKPVVDSGRGAYNSVVGGVHWYGEQWSDLAYEARAGLAHGERAATADVLAELADAKIVHNSPGRARLRLQQIKGDGALAAKVAAALEGVRGVERVQASPSSGSLLIFYDLSYYGSLEALLQSIGE